MIHLLAVRPFPACRLISRPLVRDDRPIHTQFSTLHRFTPDWPGQRVHQYEETAGMETQSENQVLVDAVVGASLRGFGT